MERDYKVKYSGFDPSKDESYIIFEIAQKRNLGESIRVAGDAQNELVNNAGRANRGVRQAGFWVLWATSMPAVLVELDFICNPESVKYMTSEKGEDKFAESLFNSIKKFVDRRK
ncbi:MAG: N-acetylmuramoyl-L-alanine amidase, partial [Muribaculaceae bacterium]|nr:N-acetylmuramoyl-L-alanine amidase [Muribaculaceae bacterium]